MKKTVRFTTSVAAVAVATAAIPFSAEASSNFEMRKKVVTLSGIVTSKDNNQRGICRNAGQRFFV